MTALDFRPRRATCKRSNRRLLRGGLPFSARQTKVRGFGFCCSRVLGRASVDCQRVAAFPRLSPGTLALCSSDFPLIHRVDQRPSPTPCDECLRVVNVRGRDHHSRDRCPVPRGRFELPRGYPHYALNVARLPVPPHRPVCPRLAWSRPADSNRRPAVYETAALPTELGRHMLPRSGLSISGAPGRSQSPLTGYFGIVLPR